MSTELTHSAAPLHAGFGGLEVDYPYALVRVASLRADQVQHLLFGWVELFPYDMEAPSRWTAGDKPWSVPSQSRRSCAFSATKMPTLEALRWYADAGVGTINVALGAPKPVLASTRVFAPEPMGGHFAVSVDAPFGFAWHDGPRVHRLVPMRRPARAVLELASSKPAREWLRDNLGFDIFEREDWLCGLAMLAPDPVCSSFSLARSDRTPEGLETISIQATPRRIARRTSDLTTLSAYIAERRSGAWTNVRSVSIPQDGFTAFQMPQPTEQLAWAVVCSQRGVLRVSEPHPWLDQIGMTMSMHHGMAEVEVPSGGRRKPAQRYRVAQAAATETSTVGMLVDDRARRRLARLNTQHRRREQRTSAPQFLFGIRPCSAQASPDEIEAKKKEAQDFVVGLVSQARSRLIFVDPFFSDREARLFALRNSQQEVVPRILTGVPGLKALVGDAPGFQVQRGLRFAADIKKMADQLGARTPIVRVMPGQDQAAIHDRYLIIDDEVWHCGPSFNELGERLGLIVRLPNPMEIRVMVARVWLQSRPLLDFISTGASSV